MRLYKVALVAAHCCIRVGKQGVPLCERGHTVHLMAQKMPAFVESYDSFVHTTTGSQLRTMVKIMAPHVDLFVVHNEPSWMVSMIKEVTDKPVILDVHDSYLARSTPEQAKEAEEARKPHMRIYTEERANFQLADGLVFPSKPFGEMIRKEYMLEQPYRIIPSFVPQNMQCYGGGSWEPGVVYEGRVDLPETLTTAAHTGFNYTDYLDFAKKCDELDIDFHIYARHDEKFQKEYKGLAVLHQPVVYQKLFKAISKHDWGLVGNIHYTSEWEYALPNKLFEYVASGVPVVAINAKHCSEWLEEYGIGITVESVEELRDRWSEHTEVRKNLFRVRGKLVMEQHIHELEDLFGEVLDAR